MFLSCIPKVLHRLHACKSGIVARYHMKLKLIYICYFEFPLTSADFDDKTVDDVRDELRIPFHVTEYGIVEDDDGDDGDEASNLPSDPDDDHGSDI